MGYVDQAGHHPCGYYEIIYIFKFFWSYKMASAVAMMIGGAVVIALAFTGGNFLFSKLEKNSRRWKRKREVWQSSRRIRSSSSSLESKENAKIGFYQWANAKRTSRRADFWWCRSGFETVLLHHRQVAWSASSGAKIEWLLCATVGSAKQRVVVYCCRDGSNGTFGLWVNINRIESLQIFFFKNWSNIW